MLINGPAIANNDEIELYNYHVAEQSDNPKCAQISSFVGDG